MSNTFSYSKFNGLGESSIGMFFNAINANLHVTQSTFTDNLTTKSKPVMTATINSFIIDNTEFINSSTLYSNSGIISTLSKGGFMNILAS